MSLPLIGDYSDAVQNPSVCFDDPELAELAAGRAEVHPQRHTPLVYAGNFAAVYPFVCGGGKYAVRCFTREVNEPGKRRERYEELDTFLSKFNDDAFVTFKYHERGIRVKGEWHPIVRMAWVDGSRLDRFVEDNLSRPNRIREVCDRLLEANKTLRVFGIAHNDLQHGNLMVQPDGAIRLVDYDGIFLPRFRGQPSPELGHAQYQHPQRKVDDYGEYVDNFPALVLYLSLMAVSVDPGLWQQFYTQDNLIFTKGDYADPANSECFRALKGIPDAAVRHLTDYLERCCSMPVDQVPDLTEILSGAPAPSAPVSPAPSAPPVASGPAPAAPPPSGPTQRVVGGGSDYLRLLQMGQAGQMTSGLAPSQPAAAPQQPPTAAPASVACPRCNRNNELGFVYCGDENCYAELHSGSRFCAYCGQSIPVVGNFCRECGAKIA